MINAERLWNRLHELGEIGKQANGGITRFSFTEEERAAKDLLRKYMEEAGLIVNEDDAGNILGKKEGLDPLAQSILIGSHIDSVKEGGIFDGPLGVIGGIEVLQTLNEQGFHSECDIEVIAFSDEEGGRFSFGMLGSKAIAGTLEQGELNHTDKDGISILEAMTLAGYDSDNIESIKRKSDSIKYYLELHIEQGKVLEEKKRSVGVVTGIAGPLWLEWTLAGESGHAGATPMHVRTDPLLAFAEIVQMVNAEVKKQSHTVATIGKVNIKPGGINIIPGEIAFSIDLRDVEETIRNDVEEAIKNQAKDICDRHQISLKSKTLQRVAPLKCSSFLQETILESCQKLDLETTQLPSGAGHDGMQLKDLCPVGMIFIRSKNGISHNPLEYSSKLDCANGVNVLYETILKLSN